MFIIRRRIVFETISREHPPLPQGTPRSCSSTHLAQLQTQLEGYGETGGTGQPCPGLAPLALTYPVQRHLPCVGGVWRAILLLGGKEVARKTREGVLDGGPGSKFKLNGLKGGQGPTILALEQTVLNLPQEKVDRYQAKYEEMLEEMFGLMALKIDDLKKSPKHRSFTKLNELASALLGVQQTVQALAGYTTKSLEIPIDAISAAIARREGQVRELDGFFEMLDAEIEALRVEEEANWKPALVLPAGSVTIEGEVDAEAGKYDGGDAERTRGKLFSLGYIRLDGTYTGKLPPEGARADLLAEVAYVRERGGWCDGSKGEVPGGEEGGAADIGGGEEGAHGGPGEDGEGGDNACAVAGEGHRA